MNFFDFIKDNKLIILITSIIGNILLLIISIYYIIMYFNCNVPIIDNNNFINSENIKNEISNSFFVEIKGAVNNPGVYKVDDTNIINDLINLADGLTKNAYTKNINLSKKLVSEMVIYIYTEKEYKNINKKEEIKEAICECPSYNLSNCLNNFASEIIVNESISDNNEIKENTNSLVNINSASKEELMTLSGIGESKANDIIDYRKTNGLFKSIDDIKNVNGIGNSIYEKIKDFITV